MKASGSSGNEIRIGPGGCAGGRPARPRCFNAAWIECQFTVDESIK